MPTSRKANPAFMSPAARRKAAKTREATFASRYGMTISEYRKLKKLPYGRRKQFLATFQRSQSKELHTHVEEASQTKQESQIAFGAGYLLREAEAYVQSTDISWPVFAERLGRFFLQSASGEHGRSVHSLSAVRRARAKGA